MSVAPECAVCGAECDWVDDAWCCTDEDCAMEWYPDHGPQYAIPGTAEPLTDIHATATISHRNAINRQGTP